MSSPTPTQITVTAHESHWQSILLAILQAVNAANPFIAKLIPAPVEAGIQIATTVVPVVINAEGAPQP